MVREESDSLTQFHFSDGIKAIMLYVLDILLLFLQGYLYTTNIAYHILNCLQILLAFVSLFLGIIFVKTSKDRLNTIGITTSRLWQSVLLGILGAFLLIGLIVLYFIFVQDTQVGFQFPPFITIITFVFCAMSEEIVYRGYIQTRLTGIFHNNVICSCITAILFLFSHYPTKWMAIGEFSIDILSGFYIICLIVLHFTCDLVYRKTNCLWGAIILHIIYNIGTGMLVFL